MPFFITGIKIHAFVLNKTKFKNEFILKANTSVFGYL